MFVPLFLSLSLIMTYKIHADNPNTDNIFGTLTVSFWRKLYTPNHLTQAIGSVPLLSLSLQIKKFTYRTSILTIYSGLLLSRHGLQIYVLKYLSQTMFLIFSLSLSLSNVTTYEIHLHNLNTDIIFGHFLNSFWCKNICI